MIVSDESIATVKCIKLRSAIEELVHSIRNKEAQNIKDGEKYQLPTGEEKIQESHLQNEEYEKINKLENKLLKKKKKVIFI